MVSGLRCTWLALHLPLEALDCISETRLVARYLLQASHYAVAVLSVPSNDVPLHGCRVFLPRSVIVNHAAAADLPLASRG
jgi:hypothetical protein